MTHCMWLAQNTELEREFGKHSIIQQIVWFLCGKAVSYTHLFRVLLPEQGLAVREEQIRLCHEMLDTLLGEQIALCDAGVGIGKTYAYLVACVLLRKYSMLTGRGNPLEQRPVVVSTSSIALQLSLIHIYFQFKRCWNLLVWK